MPSAQMTQVPPWPASFNSTGQPLGQPDNSYSSPHQQLLRHPGGGLHNSGPSQQQYEQVLSPALPRYNGHADPSPHAIANGYALPNGAALPPHNMVNGGIHPPEPSRVLPVLEQRRLLQNAIAVASSRPGTTPIQVLMQEGYACIDAKHLPNSSMGGLPDGNMVVASSQLGAFGLSSHSMIPPFSSYGMGMSMAMNTTPSRGTPLTDERPLTAGTPVMPVASPAAGPYQPHVTNLSKSAAPITPYGTALYANGSPAQLHQMRADGSVSDGLTFDAPGPDATRPGSSHLLGAPNQAQPLPFSGGTMGIHGPPRPGFDRNASAIHADLSPVLGGHLPQRSAAGFEITRFNTRTVALSSDDEEEPDDDHRYTPLTERDENFLLGIMHKDNEYSRIFEEHQQKMTRRFQEYGASVRKHKRAKIEEDAHRLGPSLHWWERSVEENRSAVAKEHEGFKIIFPSEKERALLEKSTYRSPRFELDMSAAARKRVALQQEDVVPIRLELDFEPLRLRDTFLWNANDDHVSADTFAANLCEEIGLPVMAFAPAVRESVQSQVQEHLQTKVLRPKRAAFPERSPTGTGRLGPHAQQWWSKARNVSSSSARCSSIEDGADAVEGDAAWADDLRIPIKLDITVGGMQLIDHFEWDIAEERNSPEQFADVFATELGLAGEFRTAIAHSIREQAETYIRCLILVGHAIDRDTIADDELRNSFLPPLMTPARSEADAIHHTPRLSQLSEAEIDRIDREKEREARRKRRQTRGRRGVTLPDREPLKTQRTPAVYGLQSVAPGDAFGFAASMSGAGITNAPAPSRRAAAIAAAANLGPGTQEMAGTPPPVPEIPTLDERRLRTEHYRMHFRFPGGLGRPRSRRHENEPTKGRKAAERTVPSQTLSAPVAEPLEPSNGRRPGSATPAVADPIPGQHPNYFDGEWYCANCGVPGSLSPGRRKGPGGEKTLCGLCGKFWHRHRRIRPVEYTRDLTHHQALRAKAIPQKLGMLDGDPQSPGTFESGHVSSASSSAARGVSPEVAGTAQESRPAPHGQADQHTRVDPTPLNGSATGISGGLAAPSAVPSSAERGHANVAVSAAPAPALAPSVPSTRPGSPDLPFQAVGSFSDSESNSDSEASDVSHQKQPQQPQQQPQTQQLPQAQQQPQQQPQQQQYPGQALSPAMERSISAATATSHAVSASGLGDNAAPSASPRQAALVPAALQDAASKIPPPGWLAAAAKELRAKYPDDRFEISLRPRPAAAGVPAPSVPEWRLRCLDCPGKLYTPGPGETLTNFGIHLKNRAHRAAVAKRIEEGG